MIEAIRLLAEHCREWTGTVIGVFVADEEVASSGTKTFLKTRPKIDYVIVGEPTSNTTVTAHKGSVRPIVRIFGQTAHLASADFGENAIFRAAKLLELAQSRHLQLREQKNRPVGYPTLTVTRISGGHADSVVPDVCEVPFDRRVIPSENSELVKLDFERFVSIAYKDHGVLARVVGYRPTTEPCEMPEYHPLVEACITAGNRNGCSQLTPEGFQCGCDLVHFRSIDVADVVLGPGSISVAHKRNEFIPEGEFVNAARI